eukprot:gnl/MRDRNA2_/MRDRNA2_89247_c0_seq1.p1 gnl/MRDRNA2_/MRDRNA2_89247_c0~~gnl/MRDRNA2_/MRDRNA2_89247_c0_seq1.p1  ORF type:complete len:324 (+),score=53.10 gnl/MRDRNA2_/MRDRNA2_89247_c0_seq1:67-1038(+)
MQILVFVCFWFALVREVACSSFLRQRSAWPGKVGILRQHALPFTRISNKPRNFVPVNGYSEKVKVFALTEQDVLDKAAGKKEEREYYEEVANITIAKLEKDIAEGNWPFGGERAPEDKYEDNMYEWADIFGIPRTFANWTHNREIAEHAAGLARDTAECATQTGRSELSQVWMDCAASWDAAVPLIPQWEAAQDLNPQQREALLAAARVTAKSAVASAPAGPGEHVWPYAAEQWELMVKDMETFQVNATAAESAGTEAVEPPAPSEPEIVPEGLFAQTAPQVISVFGIAAFGVFVGAILASLSFSYRICTIDRHEQSSKNLLG